MTSRLRRLRRLRRVMLVVSVVASAVFFAPNAQVAADHSADPWCPTGTNWDNRTQTCVPNG